MTDHELVLRTIGYYITGGNNGEPETVARAFHPSAYMKFVKEGKLIDVPIQEYFAKYIQNGLIQQRTVTIDHVAITGDAGAVRLNIDYSTHRFIDYFSLLKVGGEWLIVSKIFQRIEK